MADEVTMTPVTAAQPPKANPLIHKPVVGGGATAALKPGLKLPPKPALAGGLKLPPKPGATVALKPVAPGALKPGLKLPPKPVIRKPGATVVAAPLPKPVARDAASPAAPAAPAARESPKPMEALKSVTQKMKGKTQEIPQQAILRKTGIIAEGAMSEAQKEAAKHKTARISLSDAMGVAPVKNENAPMKTIRIKRPVDIPGATKPLTPQPAAAAAAPAPAAEAAPAAADSEATITQRKTLKITRPAGAVRPAGKFGIKRPTAPAAASASAAAPAPADGGAVADIADIPDMPMAPVPSAVQPASDAPSWVWTLSTLVQAAACVAIGALAWFLYQNSQASYF